MKIEKEIISVSIEKEIKKNYLLYATSVMNERALPDIRDGLKPVHRRILYSMYRINNIWNKPFIKCARIVGEVMGKYHPHGDNSIYEALVRMAQNFSLRYTLIEGQGNFGSIDGDNAAAMRYTECRLNIIAKELLKDIDKKTVFFISNYDGKEKEPIVFPSRIPNLLINGSSGIAVGISTNIPPHNINEVIDAILFLLKNKKCSIKNLINIIKAPDFPTKGLILGLSGINKAYNTGKGKVIIRSKAHIKKINNNKVIIIKEIPYQINKTNLIKNILKLILKKKINGISKIRDESDKLGIRIIIFLKKNQSAKNILNMLYKKSKLQHTFSINMIALVNCKPKLLNLKQILEYYIFYRKEIIIKSISYKIKKLKKKNHILKGLIIALFNIKKLIKIIRFSNNIKKLKNIIRLKNWENNLKKTNYVFSKIQINKILSIRLHKLTILENKKFINKYIKIKKIITELSNNLKSSLKLDNILCKELLKLKKKFKNDKRLSRIIKL